MWMYYITAMQNLEDNLFAQLNILFKNTSHLYEMFKYMMKDTSAINIS